MTLSEKGKILRLLSRDSPEGRVILGIAGAVLFLVFWEFLLEPIARTLNGNPGLEFPTFSESIGALLSSFTYKDSWNPNFMGEHLAYSLIRVLLGFGIAAFVAVPLALLMGYIRSFEHFLFPINEIARPIPPLAWIPVAVVLLSGELKVVFICFLGAYFPILINTLHGVKTIDPLLFDAARTLGAKKSDIFFKIVVPGASGSMMTGLRIGLGIAWMTIVAAEMIGSTNGVGWYIYSSALVQGVYVQAMGGMILIGLIGYLIFLFMEIAERRFLKWIGMQ
ncbi:MAG: ABC transporter permease [Thermoplasmata archaeon]